MKIFIFKKRLLALLTIGLILVTILSIGLFKKSSQEVFKDEVYYKGIREEKIVSFLCNIDWGNEYIPELLKIFEENSIKITFSITGRWANENKDMVKEIYSKGHEIANHGYLHVDHDKLNYDDNYDAINKTNDILEDIIGERPKYFGPPSGAFNESTVRAAKDLNNTVIMWSVDTIDWREDSTKELIVGRVIKDINPSDIVLMHPTENTVVALPEIIDYLFENDFKIGTISDILK